jgi:ubiquinone/menaquinone biosynthesis C-methylase UbiE
MRVRQTYEPVGLQGVVNSHFTKATSYWAEVYERQDDVDAIIYQERLQRVLTMVDGMALPPRSPVLEVGPGAGYATVALARRGFVIDAIDPVQSMLELTRVHVAKAGLESTVKVGLGDIHALPFPDEVFRLVVVMGVLDWFPSIDQPIREVSRVLQPGGYSIVTMDNRWGLRQFVEPYTNPILRPPKEALKKILRWSERNRGRALTHLSSQHETDETLRAAGLEKKDGVTLGFGPFRIFNQKALPNFVGLKVHRRLQSLADLGIPVFRSCGGQYIVLSKKSASRSD